MKPNSRRTPRAPESDDDTRNAADDAVAADVDEASDLDDLIQLSTNEADWDVFIPDDDERDPLPEHGDFWDDAPFDE